MACVLSSHEPFEPFRRTCHTHTHTQREEWARVDGRRGVDTNGGAGGRTDGGDRLLHPHTGRRLPGKAIWKPTPKVNGLLH